MSKLWLVGVGLAGVAAFAPLVSVAGGASVSPLRYLWQKAKGQASSAAQLNGAQVGAIGESAAEAALLAA